MTTHKQGTQTAPHVLQSQYQDKGVQVNIEDNGTGVVLHKANKISGGNKRKRILFSFVFTEEDIPARKHRRNN